MRKLQIIFNVLMLTSLCIGCSNVETRYEVIDLAGAVHNVEPCKLSTYASNIDYLPIGSEDSVLLGDIYDHMFLVDEEHIFIVAPKMKCIYMFGRDGKLIRSIGQRGRAYGEYTATRSMMSDSGSDLLMVEGGNKMFSFVDAGTFIEMSKKCNSPKMKEVARKLTEESNPVLIEVTLK